MFNFKKYFAPMSQYMAAQTQITQLTAKKDSLEAEVAELETSAKEEQAYSKELFRDIVEFRNELQKTKDKYAGAKDCIRIQNYLITLFFACTLGELFVILALI